MGKNAGSTQNPPSEIIKMCGSWRFCWIIGFYCTRERRKKRVKVIFTCEEIRKENPSHCSEKDFIGIELPYPPKPWKIPTKKKKRKKREKKEEGEWGGGRTCSCRPPPHLHRPKPHLIQALSHILFTLPSQLSRISFAVACASALPLDSSDRTFPSCRQSRPDPPLACPTWDAPWPTTRTWAHPSAA